MARPIARVQSELDQPLVFRTTKESVGRSTTEKGEIWLRSDGYFRQLEDKARNDEHESLSLGRHQFPFTLPTEPHEPTVHLEGEGGIAELPEPHYILSLHGTSIEERIRQEFGGFTFGVRNINRLSEELYDEANKQLPRHCPRWEWRQIAYQYSGLTITDRVKGAAFQFAHNPPRALRVINPGPFRKRPIAPFIGQDEWRIVLWTGHYLGDDPNMPLKVRVSPELFYR